MSHFDEWIFWTRPVRADLLPVFRLAASEDPFGVTLGGILGHLVCTGAAVLGGRHLATHIDEKTVGVSGCPSAAFATCKPACPSLVGSVEAFYLQESNKIL